MALIVEDGTGLPDANSFVSLADADAFLTAEGAEAWVAEDSVKREAALVSASRWISTAYVWIGAPLSPAQALAWPRSGTAYENTPPTVLIAVFRLAREALGRDLFAAQTRGRERVKAGSVEVEYDPITAFTSVAGGARFPWIAPLLRGLTLRAPGDGVRKIVRV